jgi:hypothetical protein
MPWRLSPEKQAAAREEKNDSLDGGGSAAGVSDSRLRFLAGELSPLLDRLGRVLTDFAPHLRTYSDSPSRVGDSGAEESKDQEQAAGSSNEPTAASAASGGSRSDPIPRDALEALTSLLRSRRAPSPPTGLAYRQNVSTSTTRSGHAGSTGNSGHLDIHIHAILTPLNRPLGTTANSSETTSVAGGGTSTGGGATAHNNAHHFDMNSAVNAILLQNARNQQEQRSRQLEQDTVQRGIDNL